MSNEQTFLFHVGFTGSVNRTEGTIKGVRVITGNVSAEGHDLEVDSTTVKQLFTCAAKNGQVPVNLDHGSGIKDTCGYLDNFHIDGADLRADWHLLKAHAEYDATLERAERMPGCFGLSVKFKGKGEKKGLKKFARCEKLVSVDCVTQPAANPDGLFSVPKPATKTEFGTPAVDNGHKRMAENPDPNSQSQGEPIPAWAQQILDGQQAITARLDEQQQALEGLQQQPGEGEPLSPAELDQLNGMTDEQLEGLGLTRSEVEAAVAEANVGGDGGDGGYQPAGEGTGTGEGAAAPGTVGAALNALQREIIALKKARQADIQFAEQEQVDHAFSVIESKAQALVTELAAKDAEILSLRSVIKTNGKGVKPGVETLFSANPNGEETNTFKALVQKHKAAGKSDAEAIRFAQKENPDAHREWVQLGAKS